MCSSCGRGGKTLADLSKRIGFLQKEGCDIVFASTNKKSFSSEEMLSIFEKNKIKYSKINIEHQLKLISGSLKSIFALSQSDQRMDIEEEERRQKESLERRF